MSSRTLELSVLHRISQALAHHQDVSALLHEVLDILETQMGMRRGTLTLRRAGTEELHIEASKGLTPQEMRRGKYRIGEGVTGRVAATLEPAIVPDVSREPAFLDRTGTRRDASVAFLCVPIIRQDELLGTLSIDYPTASPSELEQRMELLKIVSNILAEAVANFQLHAEERQLLKSENRKLRQELGEQFRPTNIIGNCSAMREVYDQIAQVANSTATVLIRGETGTGKELVAKALHFNSNRRNGPFVSCNIGALQENLVESELFGHVRGAFTGAVQQRKGRFESADGGTLFLDEIGDISQPVQVGLLRVLQERVFERVGSSEPVQVNVRVVAATSRDLEQAMTDERFREDLYYRLNVFPIYLPPLRERRSDITLLADHFLDVFNRRYGKSVRRISTPAINMLMSYHWPGNVRELENCLEHAVLRSSDDVIHGFNLPPTLQTAKETHTEFIPVDSEASLEMLVESYEREILVDALKSSRGNCAAAARSLKTTARIFNYRVKRLGIDPRAFKV